MTDKTPDIEILPPEPKQKRRRATFIIAGLAALGIAGAAGTAAIAQGGHGFGHGMWRHGGHWGGQMGGQVDPARMNAAIERGIKHLAIEIDATADQQAKLITIAQGAAKDLLPLREKVQAARQKGRELLVSPTLDRAAIEGFRAEQQALFEQASKRIAQAVGDVAEVLTPEQRAKIGNRLPFGRGFGMGGPGMSGPGMGRDHDGPRPGWHRG